jgi:hypothetical protein
LVKSKNFSQYGSLFGQGSVAKADLDPAGGAVVEEPCIAHVAEILSAGNGALAERAAIDRFEKRLFTSGL